jgi:peptide/nickel transport system permease protein
VSAFVVRRLLLALLVLFAFSFLSFAFAERFPPLKGQPLLPAYERWLRGVANGRSFHGLLADHPFIGAKLLDALGHTAALLVLALIVVVALALAVGTIAASFRGSPLDGMLRIGSYVAWATPAFLLALIVQQVMNALGTFRGLGPFPIAGWPGFCPAGLGLDAGTLRCYPAGTGPSYALHVLESVTLPALALAAGFVGLHARYLRASLVVALAAPYTTTARAKGLAERTVVLRHALRNSVVTFVAAVLADFGALFGAALAVDAIFRLDGLGTLYLATLNPSLPVLDAYQLQLLLLLTGVLLLASSFLSELAVVWLDPRARLE